MKTKRKRINHIFLKIIGAISVIIFIVFGIMLNMLDMIPHKYLLIFFVIFIIIYLILLMLIFVKNIKKKLKKVATIIFILFDIIFLFGIKYIGETMNFFDVINKEIFQKEVYYVMTLKSSNIEEIEDLNKKDIGIYKSNNSHKAGETLEEKVKSKLIDYDDIIEMFEHLQEEEIDAVLISDSILNLLSTDLSDMDLDLKEIYKLSISIEKQDIVKVADVTKETFNIYVAGGDAFGSIDNVTNTDVNMVITVDPEERKLLLTSIPRDYYVNLPSYGETAYDKLTHAGYYGINESVAAIENLLDIDINYYVKVNFSTVVGVIDAIGGVDVNSDYSFCVTTTGVCVRQGMNHLTGYQAMMFARERKSFADGDVQRVKNQQKVIEAVIKKATSSTTIITNFSQILDSVSESVATNLDTKSMNRFVKMQLNNMSGWEIDNQNLTGISANSTNTYTFPGTQLYVMKQDEESVKNAKDKIKGYFE